MTYVTKLKNPQTDTEYQKFIRICNEVLPLKIEELYINLDNVIEQYLNMLFAMGYNDHETLKMGLINSKTNNNVNKQTEKEEDISKQIKELAEKDSKSSSDYAKLMRLVQMGRSLALEKENGLSVISENRVKTIKRNEASSEMQNGISDIILRIKNTLKNISELDLDTNKRLDNLEVTKKHINQINNLNIDDKKKQNAYLLLIEFLQSRKNAFKVTEDFAYYVLEKYQKRETDFSEDLYKKYMLSSTALEALELGDSVFSKGNFIFNDFYSDELLTTSKIYNAYMNGEVILPEMFKEARKKEMDYRCNVLINEVERVVERQPNNGFNM